MNGAAIIERFGGVRPLARLLGVAPSTVQYWKDVDLIPSRHQPLIFEAGQALTPPLQPDAFFKLREKA